VDNSLILEGARSMGIELSCSQQLAFQSYYDSIIKWEDRVGLVSRNDRGRIVSRHFLDSLSPISEALLPDSGTLVDIGSGAGFPGIPLAICKPGLSVRLIESNRKKAGFLRYALKAIGLAGRVSVLLNRAETIASEILLNDLFDVVVSRAMGSIGMLVSLGSPLLKPGGMLLLYKGRNVADELKKASDNICAASCVFEQVLYLSPSTHSSGSSLVVIQKK
ncbi:uncharacterized protein METZ01_LOCUS367332, partial [marine metagenome]